MLGTGFEATHVDTHADDGWGSMGKAALCGRWRLGISECVEAEGLRCVLAAAGSTFPVAGEVGACGGHGCRQVLKHGEGPVGVPGPQRGFAAEPGGCEPVLPQKARVEREAVADGGLPQAAAEAALRH